jgi:hypothetical protein
MRIRTFLAVAALILGSNKAFARVSNQPADPCQSSAVAKSSVPISVPAGVTVLVPASTKTIHVCGFTAGSGGLFSFEYGSGSACGTGTTALRGDFGSNPISVTYTGPGTVFSVPANNGLCINEANEPVTGVLTYTQP